MDKYARPMTLKKDYAILGVVVVSKPRVGDMPIVFIFKKYAKSQIFMKINECTNLWRPFKKCQNLMLKIEFSSL